MSKTFGIGDLEHIDQRAQKAQAMIDVVLAAMQMSVADDGLEAVLVHVQSELGVIRKVAEEAKAIIEQSSK